MRDYSNVSTLINSLSSSSSLFGNTSLFGNNSSSSSFNLVDYSLIKSGSYTKLMKAYYDDSSKLSNTNTSSLTNTLTKTAETVDKTGLTKMKAEADSLKKASDTLNSSDMWSGSVDSTKITDAVKSFVSSYNSAIEQSSNTSSSDVSTSVKWMTSMTSTMAKSLEKIGITVGTDNKLTVDEDALNKADTKSIKSLFNGDYSYGGQIGTKANSIISAVNSTGLYTSNATYSNTLSSILNVGI